MFYLSHGLCWNNRATREVNNIYIKLRTPLLLLAVVLLRFRDTFVMVAFCCVIFNIHMISKGDYKHQCVMSRVIPRCNSIYSCPVNQGVEHTARIHYISSVFLLEAWFWRRGRVVLEAYFAAVCWFYPQGGMCLVRCLGTGYFRVVSCVDYIAVRPDEDSIMFYLEHYLSLYSMTLTFLLLFIVMQ